MASACICTLIKHAKISQSRSLLEWFKIFDYLNKTKAVKHVKTKHQSYETVHSSNETPALTSLRGLPTLTKVKFSSQFQEVL